MDSLKCTEKFRQTEVRSIARDKFFQGGFVIVLATCPQSFACNLMPPGGEIFDFIEL